MFTAFRPSIFDAIPKRAIGDNNSDLGDERTPGVDRDDQQGEINVLKNTMQGFNTTELDQMAINAQKETETQQKHKANEPNRTGAVEAIHNKRLRRDSIIAKACQQKIDLSWEHLNIKATTKKRQIGVGKRKTITEEKTILNNISGSVRHGKFTAIMGPSGSGKTTLLNFLSARISGKNLKINGLVKINGQPIEKLDDFTSSLAYVMQDDILVATMTAKESFMFVASLRLRISKEERKKKVEDMLADLKLSHVANTKIGNNLIRGVSGGERKRVSIGVELITDPSLIFLDEPTTGLDSKTAETVIKLLDDLAKKGGRTVVSTIHQPSSQIYNLFDELLMMVRGNIIYQGPASQAVSYFASIGFPCPKLTNPSDYFMKIVNESGVMIELMGQDMGKRASRMALGMTPEEIEKKFAQRLEVFKKGYMESGMAVRALEGLETQKVSVQSHKMVNWFKQFYHIFIRKCQYEIRNPMESKVKIFQKLLFSFIIMLAFNNLQTGRAGVQNRNGVIFFYSIMTFMAGVQGSIGTFSSERPIFIRERLSKTYSTSAYFWANAVAELPLLIAQPVILVAPSYFVIQLHTSAASYFLLLVITICCTIAGSGYGLLVSTFVPSMELAMTIVPILIIPMMLCAGFFVSQENIPYYFYEFEFLSPVKYAFQAGLQNEFRNSDVCPTCDYYATLQYYQGIGLSIGILLIIAVGLRFIAYIGLGLISAPKKAKVLPPKENYEAGSTSLPKEKSKQ